MDHDLAVLGLHKQYRRAKAKYELARSLPIPSKSDVLKFLSKNTGAIITEENLFQLAMSQDMTQEQLLENAITEINFRIWAAEKFKGQIESEFLRTKSHLTMLSYSIIRSHDRELIFELFHRLEAAEASFVELAYLFSEGPERVAGGFISEAPASDIVKDIAQRLFTMKDGSIATPFQQEDYWIILRLNSITHPVLDSKLRLQLALTCAETYIQDM